MKEGRNEPNKDRIDLFYHGRPGGNHEGLSVWKNKDELLVVGYDRGKFSYGVYEIIGYDEESNPLKQPIARTYRRSSAQRMIATMANQAIRIIDRSSDRRIGRVDTEQVPTIAGFDFKSLDRRDPGC